MSNLDILIQLTKAQKDLRWLKESFWNVRRHLTNNPDDLENAEKQLIEIKTMHDETERKIKELNNAITLNSPVLSQASQQSTDSDSLGLILIHVPRLICRMIAALDRSQLILMGKL